MFEEVLNLEANAYDAGYRDGLERGRIEGSELGRDMGKRKAEEILSELGVYVGFCSALLQLNRRLGHFELSTRELNAVVKAQHAAQEALDLFKQDHQERKDDDGSDN